MGMMNNGLSYWQAETEGVDLLDLTIGDLLDQRAEENPSQEAIVYSCYPEFGDALNIRWTYQDYCDRANAVARGLLALGLAKGDHIAVWAANLPEWPILMMAAAKAGLVLVTINPLLQAREIEYILKQGDVQALFFMARVRTYDHLATLTRLVLPGSNNGEVTSERLPKLRFFCLMGMPPAGLREQESWRPAFLNEISAAGSQVSDMALAERQASVSPSDEQLTEGELRVYCQNQISHQKTPRYFQFVEKFPLRASGKVQKFVLREQAIKALDLEGVAKIETA